MLVNQLIVIAGYSCAGKSTLIRALFSNENEVGGFIKIDADSHYKIGGARGMDDLLNQKFDHLLLHYDLYASMEVDKNFEKLSRLISDSRDVSLVSLCASRNQLEQRLAHRLKRIEDRMSEGPKKQLVYRTQMKKNAIYQKPSFYTTYSEWFDFLDQSQSDKNILAHTGNLVEFEFLPYTRKGAEDLVLKDSVCIGTS